MITSHQGFTLIEVVYVIVILGILSAVAIPRLAATRQDAKLVVLAQSLSDALFEISSYAVAHGKTEENLTLMSDAVKSLV
jgi:general secretion pathway protein G